ncbi:ABC-2 family transporter protein [Candidatus Collierbacteria bacterium]|nr:ABC-2 family transporter protein [Candidatus Collierbacteria bacterium]
MKIFLAFAKASFGSNVTYRGAIVIWMLISLVRTGIALLMWLAAGNTIIGGYTREEIISYYVVIMFAEWFLMWNPFHPIAEEIRSGYILTMLIKPLNYAKAWFAKEAGFKFTAMGILAIAAIFVFSILKILNLRVILTPGWDWLLVIPAIFTGVVISFFTTMSMVTLAFWFTEVEYVNFLFWTIFIFIGGLWMPVSFLPNWLKTINMFLPFRYELSFPVEIIFHKTQGPELLVSLLMAGLWSIALLMLYRFLWKKGVKAYSAFGQ